MMKPCIRFLLKHPYLIISRLLHRRPDKPSTIKLQQFENKITDNPYLQSKLLWNDVYGDIERKWRSSRYLNFICIGMIACSLLGFMWIASKNHMQPLPFVIHGDDIVTVSSVSGRDIQTIKSRFIPYFAKQFIRAWRSRSTDEQVNTQQALTTYALTSDAATSVIHDFYEAHRAPRNITKNVVITSVLAISAHTLDIRWQEASQDARTGKLIQVKHYIAQLTHQYAEPAHNATVLRINPLGFYITHLSWSADQETGDPYDNNK